MRSFSTAILGAALTFGAPCVAFAAPAPAATAGAAVSALTAVSFTPRAEALEFVFRAATPVSAEQVSVYGDSDDAEVLNLKVQNARVTRRWVTMPDAQIDRALLHPASRDGGEGAVLRIRMKSKAHVDAAILDAVKVREADGAVVVLVPRTANVAAAWTRETQPAVAAAAPAPAPAPQSSAPVAAPVSSAPPSVAVAVAPVGVPAAPQSAAADKVPTAGDTPLTLVDEPAAGTDPLAEDPGSVVANAGVSESTGMGAAAMSIFLLLGGGFFLWRKIRGHRGETGTGRLIRPLGTHVLGPKQGLLLLDVAGEMVLIGTSDKGVQMLTKIDRSEKQERSPAPVPQSELTLLAGGEAAPTKTPKLNVAERAQAAIAKVRALSDARKAAGRLETADEDVTADALERSFFDRADEHLAEAAAGVEDDFEPRAENFFARLRKAAEKPESEPVKTSTARVNPPAPARKPAPAPTPVAQSTPAGRTDEAAMTNDILRKIRQLQGA